MESLESRRIAMEIGRIVTWETNFETATRHWSDTAIAMMGLEASGGLGRVGENDELLRLMHPDDRHKLSEYHNRFLTHDDIAADYRIVRPDGSVRYLEGRGRVVARRSDGAPQRVVNIVADVTERKLAELSAAARSDELKVARDRYRALIEATAAIQWIANRDGEIVEDSPTWRRATGQTYEEFRGAGWLNAIHPEDRLVAAEAWRQATRTGEFYEVEYRLKLEDGRYIWTVARGVARRNADGEVIEWIGVNEDISERKNREEHNRVIMRELSHRTKNLLAVIQSIARRTFSAAEAGSVRTFMDRLQGLAVSHDLLVRGDWRGASLRDLIDSHLEAFAVKGSQRVTIDGPDVLLSPGFAQSIGMAVHELTTNALKYGALSAGGGELRASWTVSGSHTGSHVLSLCWDERPANAPATAGGKGFGRLLLEQLVPQALGGSATYEVSGSSIQWRLEAPLSERDH